MLGVPRSQLPLSELVQRAARARLACGIATGLLAKRTLRAGDIGKHPGPKRALPSRGRSVCGRCCPLLRNTMTWPFQSFEKCLRVKDTPGAEEFISHGFGDIQNADFCVQ